MLDLMTILLVFLLKSMTASAAALPQHADLIMADSIMPPECAPRRERGGRRWCPGVADPGRRRPAAPWWPSPPRDQLAQSGADARHKRSGPNDLYLVLSARRRPSRRRARRTDRAIRASRGESTETSEAVLVADATTPYRLFVEVLR